MFIQLVVTLTTEEREALQRLSERSLRGMKEQARLGIRSMLITSGELEVKPTPREEISNAQQN